MNANEILKLPYVQRRIIVVTDKVVTDKPPVVSSRSNWSKIARAALLPGVIPMGGIAGIAVDAFLEVRRKMREGGEELMAVPWADAEVLRFPVGHPRKNVVYIGHPVDPPVYIPVADFHRFLFEHKVAEAQRLIRCLGALSVEVIRVEGWDRTDGVTIGVSTGADAVGASVSREASTSRTVLATMKLNPTKAPYIPDGLVWLSHEPLWQEVAQARLESGLDAFVIDVRSTDDYGVNANLKTLVVRTGLEVGGKFVEHRNTIWRLQGTFSPPPETATH